jgi:hypothetical protein
LRTFFSLSSFTFIMISSLNFQLFSFFVDMRDVRCTKKKPREMCFFSDYSNFSFIHVSNMFIIILYRCSLHNKLLVNWWNEIQLILRRAVMGFIICSFHIRMCFHQKSRDFHSSLLCFLRTKYNYNFQLYRDAAQLSDENISCS